VFTWLPTRFIFQQDGTPAHTASSSQANCPDFVKKDEWPPNSLNINSTDYYLWGAMLEAYHELRPKPKTAKLRKEPRVFWGNLPQEPIDKAVKFWVIKLSDWRLVLDLGAGAGHFEDSQWQWNSGVWSLVNCVVSTMLLNWCCSLNIDNAEKIE